jgi:hypothetical protein
MIDVEAVVVTDDSVYVDTPIPGHGENTFNRQLVMTKEAFIECYEKWIANKEEDDA